EGSACPATACHGWRRRRGRTCSRRAAKRETAQAQRGARRSTSAGGQKIGRGGRKSHSLLCRIVHADIRLGSHSAGSVGPQGDIAGALYSTEKWMGAS